MLLVKRLFIDKGNVIFLKYWFFENLSVWVIVNNLLFICLNVVKVEWYIKGNEIVMVVIIVVGYEKIIWMVKKLSKNWFIGCWILKIVKRKKLKIVGGKINGNVNKLFKRIFNLWFFKWKIIYVMFVFKIKVNKMVIIVVWKDKRIGWIFIFLFILLI